MLNRGTESQFLFVTCQPGAEKALKEELARQHQELRFAFSRPGFVTFKSEKPLTEDFDLRSYFARAYGLSYGKVSYPAGTEEVRAWVKENGPFDVVHFFQRDEHVCGDEPKGYDTEAWIRPLRSEFKDLGSDRKAEPGERVLDLVMVEADQLWIGSHRQNKGHSAYAGGNPKIALPMAAPSRAYLKLEEAIIRVEIPIQLGDTAVEIGSAPGGAVYSLLKRGLNVVGIDPGEMDPATVKMGGTKYHHISKPVAEVPRETLPDHIDWLLMDMNVEPRISLFAVDRLATRMKETLCGVILTVKLNKWSMASEIPHWIEHLKAMGMTRVRVHQLHSNRQEVCAVGLTRRGMARSGGSR